MGKDDDPEDAEAIGMSFQVFTVYNTKIGRISCMEYWVRYNWKESVNYNQKSGEENDTYLIT